jgi:DNA-binding MarR family transcriptional regulator
MKEAKTRGAAKARSHAASQPAEPDAFYDGGHYAVDESVGYLLHQVLGCMRRDIEARMAEHELTAAQWQPLWRLKLSPRSTSQAIARDANIDAGSMTRLLDRLEAKGLLDRERSATDRRVVNLALTRAGEAVVQHVPHVLADVNNQYLRGFSADEWRQLRSLLERMLANSPKAASAVSVPADAGARKAAQKKTT